MFRRPLLLLVSAAAIAAAQNVPPVSYSMPNGELGPGGILYRDDLYPGAAASQNGAQLSGSLGQLTDGVTGCQDDPRADCGSGPGYEWVGWRSDPSIVLQFGERCVFRTIRIHSANNAAAGAPMWKSATVSISDDGLTFRDYGLHVTTSQERQDPKARYVNIPVNAMGKYVRIHLIRADPSAWVVISDILVEAHIARDQAPPTHPR
jgi:F5/8 type C domain